MTAGGAVSRYFFVCNSWSLFKLAWLFFLSHINAVCKYISCSECYAHFVIFRGRLNSCIWNQAARLPSSYSCVSDRYCLYLSSCFLVAWFEASFCDLIINLFVVYILLIVLIKSYLLKDLVIQEINAFALQNFRWCFISFYQRKVICFEVKRSKRLSDMLKC